MALKCFLREYLVTWGPKHLIWGHLDPLGTFSGLGKASWDLDTWMTSDPTEFTGFLAPLLCTQPPRKPEDPLEGLDAVGLRNDGLKAMARGSSVVPFWS